MAATTGLATASFGAIGSTGSSTTVTITGQTGIASNSYVEAWLAIQATTQHSIDEVVHDPVTVRAGNIVAGTGFTIYCSMDNGSAYGDYIVHWVWV